MRVKYVPVDIKTGAVDPADIEAAISSETVCVQNYKIFYLFINLRLLDLIQTILMEHAILLKNLLISPRIIRLVSILTVALEVLLLPSLINLEEKLEDLTLV